LTKRKNSNHRADLLTENLSKRVTFRLTPTEYEDFRVIVHATGDSQGETIRKLIKALTTGHYHPPGNHIKELTKLSVKFSNAGNNLNQIARRLNQRKPVANNELIETIALIQIQTVQLKRAFRDMVVSYRAYKPLNETLTHD